MLLRNYDQSIIGSDNQQEVTFKERNYKSSNFKIDKPSSSSNLLTVSQSKNPENASATIDRQQVAFAIEQAQAKVGVAGTSGLRRYKRMRRTSKHLRKWPLYQHIREFYVFL
nr:unnamed protein product [Callosobruchus analis]